MIGTLISISSNSWISAWIGLEINLLAFIPLITANKNLISREAALKYFLIQALASSILLFTVIISLLKSNLFLQINPQLINFNNIIIISSLLLKIGAAPFHFWFPRVIEGLPWLNALTLMTWQKIAPIILISYILIKTILYPVIIISVIIGSLGGLNQTSIRKIIAFSSINHLGWIITAIYSNENLWLIYFLIYSLLSTNLIIFFNAFKIIHINQLFSIFIDSKILKLSLFLNILSLGGLPPFLGFIPKWLVIQYLTINRQSFIIVVITTATLITLFLYIRLCYSAFIINYYENRWIYIYYLNKPTIYIYIIISFFSTFSLFSIRIIYSMV